MKAITFSLKTIQPILVTSFQGNPNSDVSYSYIPGNVIRGVLIGRYLKHPRLPNQDIVADETSRRLFFDGTTRYLNAYLSSQEGQRTLPTLLSWKKQKGEEFKDDKSSIDFFDFSIAKPESNSIQYKSVGELFWVEEKGYVRLYTVDRTINIHNFRDRSKGRSTQTEGEIFCYDAIDRGQTFQGTILCQEADEQIIQSLLQPADAWLGGSRSAGYGHVKITPLNSSDSWSEIGSLSSPEDRTYNNILKITLLSDLILSEITPEQIRQLEAEGIGERRVEGFGRVAVNWRLEESQFIAKKPDTKPPSRREKPQLQTQESRNLARQIAERILRQKLEQLLLEQIEPHKLEANQMTNSQLSRLMIVARQALDENSRQPLDNLLNQLPSKARDQYERTKLSKKIRELLDQPRDWIEGYIQPVAIADEPATLTDELAMEYTLRLIMAIAKNAIKEKANEQ